MNIKKLILIPILLLALYATPTAGQMTNAQSEPIQKVEVRQLDKRAKILADYFRRYNSPLENHAQDFIDAADQNGLDWKLVASISGVESIFGKAAYGFNAWGWGIYGSQALGFSSWKDGIFTVTAGLKQNYFDKGLTDPYSINRVYAASPAWGWKVNYFLNDLDQFSKNYQVSETPARGNMLAKTAGSSAQLTQ